MRMEEDNEIGIDENVRSTVEKGSNEDIVPHMTEEETGLRETITNVQGGGGGDIRNDIIETETELAESLNGVQDVVETEKTMEQAEKTTKDVIEPEKTREQPEETPKKVTKKRKEAVEAGDEEELLENKRPKRTTKVAAELRSPFLNRVSKIISNTSEEEKLTWAYMFTDASIKSSIEQVFKNSGKEATKAMMRSLDKTVDPNVIDIWSFLNARGEDNWEEMEKQLEDAVVIDEKRKIKEIAMILILVRDVETKSLHPTCNKHQVPRNRDTGWNKLSYYTNKRARRCNYENNGICVFFPNKAQVAPQEESNFSNYNVNCSSNLVKHFQPNNIRDLLYASYGGLYGSTIQAMGDKDEGGQH